MMVKRLQNGGNRGSTEYADYLETASADAFMLHLKTEWFEPWGKAIEVGDRMDYPEFFTVDVVFRSSRGKSRQRFLLPTVAPKGPAND